MARWKEFTIALEFESEEYYTLSELQSELDSAINNEDYEGADKLKKMIQDRVNGKEEKPKLLDEPCFIDLDEVSAFYQSEFEDGTKFTRVYLKGGESLPINITVKDFKKLMTNEK